MGTRSVIAVPQGDSWRGRYCHWDGYPSNMLVNLHTLILRLGYDQAVDFLTEQHTEWSSITDDPETCNGEHRDEQWWIAPEGDDCGAEWCYVLYPTQISVLMRQTREGRPAVGAFGFNQGANASLWLPVGTARHDKAVTEELVRAIECGENLERCIHYASVHFEGAPSISTDVWLGRRPPSLHDAKEVEVGGVRYTLGGSAGQGTATNPNSWTMPQDTKVRYWWATVKDRAPDPSGHVRIARVVKAGYKVEHRLFVPIRGGERAIEPGTVVQ